MEFNIINKYFNWKADDKTIITAIGDDCAVLKNPNKLAISTDTFTEGVHFFANTAASDIAYKALAVNLSDIAAMSGVPKYFTLNLTLPHIDEDWISEFSTSLKNLANTFNVSLIGGDTTKGNLSITITIIGECESPVLRSGAKAGDGIFVSGELGGAKLALEQIKQGKTPNKLALERLNLPKPQIDLGFSLKGIATSCIDISDGLVQDLAHILEQSGVGANLNSSDIPIFTDSSLKNALYGGDEYELCWTANVNKVKSIKNITQIGEINDSKILTLDNKPIKIQGYNHFDI